MKSLIVGAFKKATWKERRVRLTFVASVVSAALPMQMILDMGEGAQKLLYSQGPLVIMLIAMVCALPVYLYCMAKAKKAGADQADADLWRQSAVTGLVFAVLYVALSTSLMAAYVAPLYLDMPAS